MKIITHGKMLRVIPQRSYRIAVVISHHYVRAVWRQRRIRSCRASHAGELREFVHESCVECLLFRRVVVGLIAGVILAGIETEGLRGAAVCGFACSMSVARG